MFLVVKLLLHFLQKKLEAIHFKINLKTFVNEKKNHFQMFFSKENIEYV